MSKRYSLEKNNNYIIHDSWKPLLKYEFKERDDALMILNALNYYHDKHLYPCCVDCKYYSGRECSKTYRAGSLKCRVVYETID